MARPSVKWGMVSRYFLKRHHTIVGRGGDKIIQAPPNDQPRSRNQVRIGHKCCSQPGAEVWDCYLNAIQRAFGVTRDEILND